MMVAERIKNHVFLRELLQPLGMAYRSADVPVQGLATDSRKIKPGDLFIARDAATGYINDAIRAGACGILANEAAIPSSFICPVPLVRIPELEKKIGLIAALFFNKPASSIRLVGITGTNGKTSVSYLLARALSGASGDKCGLIGTLGYGDVNRLLPGTHTTPEALSLQMILSDMRDQEIRQVVMEVSSHGIDQYRIAGLSFELAIFTNLSRDHLDYHETFEAYAATKRRLFTEYPVKNAVLNIDDPFGREVFAQLSGDIRKMGYTTDQNRYASFAAAEVALAEIIAMSADRMALRITSPWGKVTLESSLIGQYNAQNLLACFCGLCLLGFTLDEAVEMLSPCEGVPGRLESFKKQGMPVVVIDYAHTPDALEQVLKTLKQVCENRLYCVFGCGGDRDQGKRPIMGRIAGQYADRVIITSDNPRNEDPIRIIQQVAAGIENVGQVHIEEDREVAIRKAIEMANDGDIVLVAGKGHESYQEISGFRHPFSDQDVVNRILAGTQ